jgi:hypothetical protein
LQEEGYFKLHENKNKGGAGPFEFEKHNLAKWVYPKSKT